MITDHGLIHPTTEQYGDLIEQRSMSIRIGRLIATDIGDGFRLLVGPGSMTSLGDGLHTIMDDGSTSVDTGTGHLILIRAIDGQEVGGDQLSYRSITMAAHFAGIRCLIMRSITITTDHIIRDGQIEPMPATINGGHATSISTS